MAESEASKWLWGSTSTTSGSRPPKSIRTSEAPAGANLGTGRASGKHLSRCLVGIGHGETGLETFRGRLNRGITPLQSDLCGPEVYARAE
jgi:hypothetical protein